MRAVVIREPGGLDRLEQTELDLPSLRAGEALVKVGAAGVCHRDLLDRQGAYPFMMRPVVTGHEFAGEVVAVGEGVELAVGTRVANMHRAPCGACDECRAGHETWCSGSLYSYGLTLDGGYAEFVRAPVGSLLPIPASLDYAHAAFLYCTAAVSLRALRTHGRLAAGETVVITGASGGVGIHAVQVAHILGARVVAVTSHAAKVEAIAAAGADEVVVASGPFQREVLQRSNGGAHVGLELVGAPTFNSTLRSLRWGGRMVLVGNVTATRVEVNPGWLILREASITGSASPSRSEFAEILEWAASGRLRPVIAATMPLSEARAAQGRLADQSVVGRIVLIP